MEKAPDWRHSTAFTTRSVVEGASPILLVFHGKDGTWQFLPGSEVEVRAGVAAHTSHILDDHPEVHELADLPREWAAERASTEAPWERYPWPDVDDPQPR